MTGAAGILGAMPPTIAELEAVAAAGWRAPEQAPLGQWLLRAAEGFTGRANSALATGDPGMPLADALTGVCNWYAARGLPPMVAVPYPLGRPGDSDLGRLLDRRGWGTRSGPAIVMTAPTAGLARLWPAGKPTCGRSPTRPGSASTTTGDGNCRRSRGGCCSRRRSRRSPASGATAAPSPSAGSPSRHGWGGLTAVEVHPGYRRTGLATAITAALAGAAARQGAASLYLQVEEDNTAARALYAAQRVHQPPQVPLPDRAGARLTSQAQAAMM